MDRMPLLVLVFQSIPESIIIIYLGLASIGFYPKFLKVMPAATVSSLVSWLVRDMPLPFGLHSLLGLVTITGLFLGFFKVKPIKAIVAALFAVSSLLATEAVLVPIVIHLAGLACFQQAWGDSHRLLLSLPEQILLGGLAYLLVRFRISFETLARGTDFNRKKEHVDK